VHPQQVSNLIAVAVAAVVGFAGNELVARYRIRVGRKIGSAALVADGLHARTDGFTSLAVLVGAGGVALGWDWADPVIGLVITEATLGVLGVGLVRLRWVGHQLWAECEITVSADSTAVEAHEVTVNAEHNLLHALPRLSAALVHADPQARRVPTRMRSCRPTAGPAVSRPVSRPGRRAVRAPAGDMAGSGREGAW